MGCFEKLVKSHFLANVSAELRLARQTVKLMSQLSFEPSLIVSRKRKKAIYDDIVEGYGLLMDMRANLDDYVDDAGTIYYYHFDHLVFIYSKNIKQIDEALRYSFNNNGEIPLCRSRHRIDGVTVHTALIDTRILFKPATTN